MRQLVVSRLVNCEQLVVEVYVEARVEGGRGQSRQECHVGQHFGKGEHALIFRQNPSFSLTVFDKVLKEENQDLFEEVRVLNQRLKHKGHWRIEVFLFLGIIQKSWELILFPITRIHRIVHRFVIT